MTGNGFFKLIAQEDIYTNIQNTEALALSGKVLGLLEKVLSPFWCTKNRSGSKRVWLAGKSFHPSVSSYNCCYVVCYLAFLLPGGASILIFTTVVGSCD
jgi:hypothetical protein